MAGRAGKKGVWESAAKPAGKNGITARVVAPRSVNAPTETQRKVTRFAGKTAPKRKQYQDTLLYELQARQAELEKQNEDLRRAHEQLQASQERYFNLYDAAPVGYFSINEKGIVLEVNITGANMLGAVPGDMRARRFSSYIYNEDHDVYRQHRSQLFKTLLPQACAMRMVHKNGTLIWVLVEAIVARDAKSDKLVCLSTMNDITRQKKVEEALRESEEKYHLLADNTVDGIWLLDMDLKLKYCSPSSERQSGFTLQEIMEMPLEQYFTPGSLIVVTEVFLEEIPKIKADPDYNPILALDLEFYKKDGTSFWAESKFSIIRDENGKPISILGVARDITERKLTEAALRESEEKYRSLVETAVAGVASIDLEGKFTFANERVCQWAGLNRVNILGQPFIDFLHSDDLPGLMEMFSNAENQSPGPNIEFRIIQTDGQVIWLHTNPTPITIDGKLVGFNTILYNITDRKKEEAKRDLSLKIMSLLNRRGDQSELIHEILLLIRDFSGCEAVGIRLKQGDDYPYYESNGFLPGHVELENRLCAYDENGKIVRDSMGDPVLECMCGNIIRGRFDPSLPFFTYGGSFWSNCTTELLASTTEEDRQARTRNRCNGEGYESVALIPLKGETGNIGLLQLNDTRPNFFSADLIAYYEGMAQSIGIVLARKNAEEALRESESQYRLLSEHIMDVVLLLDVNLKFIYVSPSVEKMRGFTSLEAMELPLEKHLTPESLKLAADLFLGEIPRTQADPGYNPVPILDLEYYCKDGTTKWGEGKFSIIRDSSGKPVSILGEVRDITQRRQAEEALRVSEAQYRLLSEHMTDTIRLIDTNLKTTYVSPSAEKQRGFTHQEMLELPLEKQLTPESLNLAVGIFSEEIPRVEADPGYNPVHTLDLEYYCKDGTTVWAESKFSVIRDENCKPVSILAEARDITERRLAEDKLAKSYESLKKTLNDAINTMVKIVELRDPYTAGHQQKVAELATAIARTMRLEETRIDQLQMAAVTHDIGKMYVPSDILSKPGKLSKIEFDLIKTHPRSGYDIVKGMDFPSSVADAVLQHHERLDGSGYPGRLKGEDVILEAKILAVADVVEAMASHRPYRSALGINKALEEISENSGKLYDPDVVDACLELFRNEQFEFKSV